MKQNWWIILIAVCMLMPFMSTTANAQDADAIKKRMDEMEARHRREINEMKAQLKALSESQPPNAAEVNELMDELADELEETRDLAETLKPGTTTFLVTGYGYSMFKNKEGSDSSFDARVFPIFLWKFNDQLSFATEIEIELGADTSEFVLEFMDMNYIVNDYLTLRAGKILTPLSTFKEQLHPAWINRLPDQPMFATGSARLIPTSSLGIEARGAIPIDNNMVINYSAYVSNGPKLEMTGSKTGQLNFHNFSDINNNKAIGGRIGFLPIPELEVFYAINSADVSTGGGLGDVDALIQVAGFSFVSESEALGGRLDARFEYVWSDVDDVDFGAGSFNNERTGGYAQIAYRPTMSESFFKDLEGVVRYDFINNPSDATSGKAYDEDRWTVGVNYWLTPSAVVKLAYQFDDVDDPTGATSEGDAFMAQLAFGF